MLKLKSANKQYEETRENLQGMCESIDKIASTHQKLTSNMSQFLVEMEKMSSENEATRQLINNIYDEAKHFLEEEAHRHEAAIEESLSKKCSKISDEFGKQSEKILQSNANQSKALRLTRLLVFIGIALEAVIIIRAFF